jgi:hypothetical protein
MAEMVKSLARQKSAACEVVNKWHYSAIPASGQWIASGRFVATATGV